MGLVFAFMHLCNIVNLFLIVCVHSVLNIFLESAIDKSDGMVDDTSMSYPCMLFV